MQIPRLLFTEAQIDARVGDLARRISADYEGAEEVVLVGVLKGAFFFLSDLARRLTVPRRIDFMAVASYDAGSVAGSVRLLLDLRGDIGGRHVLIVEDILDSGHTLEYLQEVLRARRPASLKTCAFLRKARPREVHPTVDYVGFDIEDEWVVGYGLDFAEQYRTLPYIGVIDPPDA